MWEQMALRTSIPSRSRIAAVVCSAILHSVVGTAIAAESSPAPTEVKPVASNLREIRPGYPRDASRQGIQGNVLMQFRLSDKGRPQDVKVLLAEPQGVFEQHAAKIASKLRFKVPADWAARHPNRIMDFGVQYVIDGCATREVFPGVYTITIYELSVSSTPAAYNLMAHCKQLRESGATTDQPGQQD